METCKCVLSLSQEEQNFQKLKPHVFKNIKVIYFDLDDTLCAYWNACKTGLRKTFEIYRPEQVTIKKMTHAWAVAFRKFCPHIKESKWYPLYLKSGEPTRTELMRLALKELSLEDEKLALIMSQTYAKERNSALKVFPDTYETLEALSSHYQLGLITNGPADIQREEIRTLSLEPYFQHILIEGELGRGKPCPSVLEEAEKQSGVTSQNILFVGNSYDHDVLPAIRARWQTAWIYRTSDIPPSSESNQIPTRLKATDILPDVTIFSLKELLPMLT